MATYTGSIRAASSTTKPPTGKGTPEQQLQGSQRDAYLALTTLFKSYGLESLAPKIFNYIKQGYGADVISILLAETAEYKTRFAGNEARKKAGLAVLSPAEYLATESAYRQILGAAGMPKGFYDSYTDFTSWIGGDVSPTEIQKRVDLAVQASAQANPQVKDALYRLYGISQSGVAAYFLDRSRAEPILQRQAQAAAIGAAALRRGLNLDKGWLEGLATLNVSADQAEQGYAAIAEGMGAMLGIAGRYGDSWSQRLAEEEVFTPEASRGAGVETAAAKGKRLRSQERGMFAARQGSSVGGLSAGYRQT